MNNIITISGDPASGKSTVREALKRYYEKQGKEVVVYSTGDIFRKLANEKGMSVTEFNQFLQSNDCNVDNSIDSSVINFGKKIIEENNENKIYIIDSRLAWFNIPSSFKVRITTTDLIAGKRAFADKKRGEEDRYQTLEDAIEKTRERKLSEISRYMDLYGKQANLSNDDNFDIIIKNCTINKDENEIIKSNDELAEIIATCKEEYESGKYICKYWANPQIFLPTQYIGQTGRGIEEMEESIKTKGYIPSEEIIALQVDNFYFTYDGHHRCYGAIKAGVSFIPYRVISKNDEYIEGAHRTPRQEIFYLVKDKQYYNSRYIYPLEDYCDFRFTDYYPEAYRLNEVISEKTLEVPAGKDR